MKTYIYFFLSLTFLFFSNTFFAQEQKIEIKGKVVERNSQNPIQFATIEIVDKETQKTLKAITTEEDGNFNVQVFPTDFFIRVSFIGFLTLEIKDFLIENNKISLGLISLYDNSDILDNVEVRGEKSTIEFKLDKRVFNVGKDLSSAGASALDVLNNVPSVNVNIEGQVSLRGNTGVQILINGKPSVLASEESNALGTITAEMIEKIEVITNPSAKYQAEGTSGIINIIIKKEERQGINGSLSINGGIPHNNSIGLSLNRRTENFNLFSQLGVGYRELPREIENINESLTTQSTIFSKGTEYRNENFYNVILGTDYYINKNNVITISGYFAYEIEDQPSKTNFTTSGEDKIETAKWYREEITEANNPKYQYEVQYKRDFADHKEHDLIFSALGNFFGKDQSSGFKNFNTLGSDATNDQRTRTNFKESKYTFQLDYIKPFLKKWKLETGVHYLLNEVGNDYEVLDLVEGEWVSNVGLTNIFNYNQNVFGVYGTGSFEHKKWGFKLGLRVENTDLKTFLENTDEKNEQNFTNFFPTLHTSLKFSKIFSVQVGYSRRIFRPRLWDLNPFFNIRNNFSIRTGNPKLLPEYTSSYEISGILTYDKASMNFGVYYRYTTDVIERISTFDNNVSTFKPFNIGTNQSKGIEINGKYNPVKWLSMFGDFNYNYFTRDGVLESVSFDFDASQWFGKMTTKFKLPAKVDFEVTGRYQSQYKTVQSEISENVFLDLGIRKKILKGKGVLNFSVRDVFASRIRESKTYQNTFYLYNWGRRGRFITLGFSYGFGKGEAMEFSGRRRR